MGYLKEKYTKEYFLGSIDDKTKKSYGAAGFQSFKRGHIDKRYKWFLRNLNLKGKVVLDVGSGRGEVVNYCSKKGAQRVIGIDFSKEVIRLALDFNRGNPNIELIEMEAKDINFQNVFDVVFMLDVIEHIPDEEMELIYSNIYAALKQNGILILNTPIYKSIDDKDSSDFIPAVAGMHCNKQTKAKLISDLTNHNFRKYSLHVWTTSDKFFLSVFLYAKILDFEAFLAKVPCRISHPKMTLVNLFNRFLVVGKYLARCLWE